LKTSFIIGDFTHVKSSFIEGKTIEKIKDAAPENTANGNQIEKSFSGS
jgi:hypothetical protein